MSQLRGRGAKSTTELSAERARTKAGMQAQILSGWWYLAVCAVTALGVIGVLAVRMPKLAEAVEAYPRFRAPGERTQVMSPGHYEIVFEQRAAFDGSAIVGARPARVDCTATADRKPLALKPAAEGLSYSIGAYQGKALFSFELAASAAVSIHCLTDGHAGEPAVAVAVGGAVAGGSTAAGGSSGVPALSAATNQDVVAARRDAARSAVAQPAQATAAQHATPQATTPSTATDSVAGPLRGAHGPAGVIALASDLEGSMIRAVAPAMTVLACGLVGLIVVFFLRRQRPDDEATT